MNLIKFLKDLMALKRRIANFINPKEDLSVYAKKRSKTYLTANDTLKIEGIVKTKVEEINCNAKEIFAKYIDNPEEMFKFIESKGTKVIRAAHIQNALILLGENEGFLMPFSGLKALLVCILINMFSENKIKVALKTPELFVIQDGQPNVYFLAHQFHHWLAYINGLPGYEEKTVASFKNIWEPDFCSSEINKMSVSDILCLKEAIARDLEAIKFVKEVSREIIGSKESARRLKQGESLNL